MKKGVTVEQVKTGLYQGSRLERSFKTLLRWGSVRPLPSSGQICSLVEPFVRNQLTLARFNDSHDECCVLRINSLRHHRGPLDSGSLCFVREPIIRR